MKKLHPGQFVAFCKSPRLTAALIAWLVAVAAFSTFAPGFRFARSPAFLVPAGLFFANLLVCAVFRFARELGKKERRNFGPDILHGGLLFFMIAAALSAFSRWDGQATLQAGQQALLPDGSLVALERIEQSPPAATPNPMAAAQQWASYITVTQDGRTLAESRPLRANQPVKLEKCSLYQRGWGYKDGEAYTVIQAVQDPAYTLVLLSFAVCVLGICVTLFNKLHKFNESHKPEEQP